MAEGGGIPNKNRHVECAANVQTPFLSCFGSTFHYLYRRDETRNNSLLSGEISVKGGETVLGGGERNGLLLETCQFDKKRVTLGFIVKEPTLEMIGEVRS